MSLRPVILTGTAQLNILVGNADAYESTIQQALQSHGWNINAVRITKQTLFANQINISIDANVDTQFSAEQARINAEQDLAAIPGDSYAYYGSNLLSNVNLKILSDSSPQNTDIDTTSTDAVSNILHGIVNAANEATQNIVKGAAPSLGVAIPLAIAAVGIVLILKKK